MQRNQNYYIWKLKEDLSLRQKTNPQYSLRAYAKHLGVHSSTLSQILNGKRALPLKSSLHIIRKLSLGPIEQTLFMESIYKKKTQLDQIKIDENTDRFILDESYFKVIAEWEHYAIITLFDVADFTPTTKDISKRLNITETRTEVVINNLITSGLLKYDDKRRLKKAHNQVRTTEDIASTALQLSHLETLEIGKNKLKDLEVELRDFSSSTMAMDIKQITEIKALIREFRQKILSLVKTGQKSDVFQLAIQFYPLTQIQKTTKKTTEKS
jgi:uncharacterized protein (TIGR02147 family)